MLRVLHPSRVQIVGCSHRPTAHVHTSILFLPAQLIPFTPPSLSTTALADASLAVVLAPRSSLPTQRYLVAIRGGARRCLLPTAGIVGDLTLPLKMDVTTVKSRCFVYLFYLFQLFVSLVANFVHFSEISILIFACSFL